MGCFFFALHGNLSAVAQISDPDRPFESQVQLATPSVSFLPEEILVSLPGLPPDAKPLILVRIPAGHLTLGTPPDEPGRFNWEGPLYTVRLDRDFYLGKYEVTQAQWMAVMGTEPSYFSSRDPDCPVESVSWDDCQRFISALNQLEIGSFRLPSEAEWEYACRAGTRTRFYFGDSLGCEDADEDCAAGSLPGYRSDYMWYRGNNSPSGTKPVGLKRPNPFGLYDMHGNVLEWCEDDWHRNHEEAPGDGSPRVDNPRGPYRVYKGGHWMSAAKACRSGSRYFIYPSYRNSPIGFRLAADQRDIPDSSIVPEE